MQKFFILYRKMLKQRQLPKTRSFLLRTIYMKKLLNFWLGRPDPVAGGAPPRPQGSACMRPHNPSLINVRRKLTNCESIKLWAPGISKPRAKTSFSLRTWNWDSPYWKCSPPFCQREGREELVWECTCQPGGTLPMMVSFHSWNPHPTPRGERLHQPHFAKEQMEN